MYQYKHFLGSRLKLNCWHSRHGTHPDCDSPDRLHGQRDEAGDGVSQGQVEHQEVDIGAFS